MLDLAVPRAESDRPGRPNAASEGAPAREPSHAGFTWGLVAAVALAFAWPELGARGGPLGTERLVPLGVATVFFLHGARLPLRSLARGARMWRAHALIQGLTFLLLPACGLVFLALPFGASAAALQLGLFYLCALPSTMSSAVVFTAAARGDVALALFNATLSGLLGVLFTPAWLSLFVETSGAGSSLGAMVAELALLLLVPVALGQLVRPLLLRVRVPQRARVFFEHHEGWLRPTLSPVLALDKSVVLFVVYVVFSDSFASRTWSAFGLLDLAAVFGATAFLLALALAVAWVLGGALRLERGQRAAVLFASGTKSLAIGAPMATIVFGAGHELGPVLLPILVYHPLQLVVCAALAARLGAAA